MDLSKLILKCIWKNRRPNAAKTNGSPGWKSPHMQSNYQILIAFMFLAQYQMLRLPWLVRSVHNSKVVLVNAIKENVTARGMPQNSRMTWGGLWSHLQAVMEDGTVMNMIMVLQTISPEILQSEVILNYHQSMWNFSGLLLLSWDPYLGSKLYSLSLASQLPFNFSC